MKEEVDPQKIADKTKKHSTIESDFDDCDDFPAVTLHTPTKGGQPGPDQGLVVITPTSRISHQSGRGILRETNGLINIELPAASQTSTRIGPTEGAAPLVDIATLDSSDLPSSRMLRNSPALHSEWGSIDSANHAMLRQHAALGMSPGAFANSARNSPTSIFFNSPQVTYASRRGPGDPLEVTTKGLPASRPLTFDPRNRGVSWSECGGMEWPLCFYSTSSGDPIWVVALTTKRKRVLKCKQKNPIATTRVFYEAFPLFPDRSKKFSASYPSAKTAFKVVKGKGGGWIVGEKLKEGISALDRDELEKSQHKKGERMTTGGCDGWHEDPRPGTCGWWKIKCMMWTMDELPEFSDNNELYPKSEEWYVEEALGALTFPGKWTGHPDPVMFREAGARWKCCGEPSMYAYAALEIMDPKNSNQSAVFAFVDNNANSEGGKGALTNDGGDEAAMGIVGG